MQTMSGGTPPSFNSYPSNLPGSFSNSAYGAPSMTGYGFGYYGGQAPIPQGGYYNQMAQLMAGPSYAPQGSVWNVQPGAWNSQAQPMGAGKGGSPYLSLLQNLLGQNAGGAPMNGASPSVQPGQSMQQSGGGQMGGHAGGAAQGHIGALAPIPLPRAPSPGIPVASMSGAVNGATNYGVGDWLAGTQMGAGAASGFPQRAVDSSTYSGISQPALAITPVVQRGIIGGRAVKK